MDHRFNLKLNLVIPNYFGSKTYPIECKTQSDSVTGSQFNQSDWPS